MNKLRSLNNLSKTAAVAVMPWHRKQEGRKRGREAGRHERRIHAVSNTDATERDRGCGGTAVYFDVIRPRKEFSLQRSRRTANRRRLYACTVFGKFNKNCAGIYYCPPTKEGETKSKEEGNRECFFPFPMQPVFFLLSTDTACRQGRKKRRTRGPAMVVKFEPQSPTH